MKYTYRKSFLVTIASLGLAAGSLTAYADDSDSSSETVTGTPLIFYVTKGASSSNVTSSRPSFTCRIPSGTFTPPDVNVACEMSPTSTNQYQVSMMLTPGYSAPFQLTPGTNFSFVVPGENNWTDEGGGTYIFVSVGTMVLVPSAAEKYTGTCDYSFTPPPNATCFAND